jgi:hypothetical protein
VGIRGTTSSRERREHQSGKTSRLRLNRSRKGLKMRSLPLEYYTINTRTPKLKEMKRLPPTLIK